MTRQELIHLLNDPDLSNWPIVLAGDAEGNSFSAIDEISLEEEEDSELFEHFGTPVIVLWPV